MRLDFTKISDEEVVYELLPEGKHVLKVEKVEEKTSNKGNDFWAITFVDKDEARVFDNIFFTDKTLNRVKKMFKCLGLDVDGTFDYQPDDLVGCYINAEVLIEDYLNKETGKTKQKNTIDLWNSEPYSAKAKAKPKKEEVEELESLPF